MKLTVMRSVIAIPEHRLSGRSNASRFETIDISPSFHLSTHTHTHNTYTCPTHTHSRATCTLNPLTCSPHGVYLGGDTVAVYI